jgi:NADPH:quinone reductase-like Zn-dependent oxidoreductase
VVQADVPEPGPGEVVVAVKAAGINLFDYKVISGMLGQTRTGCRCRWVSRSPAW